MSHDRRSGLRLPTMGTLLCAAAPTPALAHGPGANALVFVAVLVIGLPIVASVTDRLALKRWHSIELAGAAAILANLAAVIAALLVVMWFYRLVGTIAAALEPVSTGATHLLRDYSAYLRLLFGSLALVLTKALFLRWYVPLPLTLRSFGALLLSTLAAVGGAIGLAALPAWLLF